MRKKSFKTIRLLLKLILLFQIYSYHFFRAEATENNYPKCFDKGKVDQETGLNDQNSDNDTRLSVIERPKRPARLLPLKMILGQEKNKTEKEDLNRFYGPAKSCEELLKIGYTRNGFYLVKGINATSNSHVEMVDCLFTNPDGVKKINQERLGFIPLKNNTKQIHHKERSKRPGSGKNNNTEEKNIQEQKLYGPPTNCVKLGELGYTLNGYYLVITESNSSRQIEVVLCRFQLPPQNNGTAMEERLGFISFEQYAAFVDQLQSSNKEIKENASQTSIKSIAGRKRRPARLIPLKLLFDGEKKNKTEQPTVKGFNSNPTNCDEIGKLGYTLNGFYIVNGSDSAGRFAIVFCHFLLPPKGADKKKSKATITERRFGVIRLLDCKAEAKIRNCGSHPDYLSIICEKSFCDEWGVKDGNILSPPRMAKLINGMDKGLAALGSGGTLFQRAHDANYIDYVWSYNETSLGSGDRHLCNNLKQCVVSKKTPTRPYDSDKILKWKQMGWVKLELSNYLDEEGQRFYFFDSPTYPGFYIIKDELGKCISVPENLDRDFAEIWASSCNSSEPGQLWYWLNLDNKTSENKQLRVISSFDLNNRRAKLINGLGKCAAYYSSRGMEQLDCDGKKDNKGMLWSWNEISLGSKDRHICNGNHHCFTSYRIKNERLDGSTHMDHKHQMFTFDIIDSMFYPGFYFIKNEFGMCVSVKRNTNQNGAEIWTDDCNPLEAGQRWKWHHQ